MPDDFALLMENMATGSCLCGAVSFEIIGNISDASLCHCSICRKATGSAFGAYGEVHADQFKWTQGEGCLKQFDSTDRLNKCFCSNCGSTMTSHHQSWPEYIYISLGCLDGNPDISLEYHQFVGSKAKWSIICDNIKQYAEWSDEIEHDCVRKNT